MVGQKKEHQSDYEKEISKLRRIKGQFEGVEKMILEGRSCADILAQIRAMRSGLLGVEASVLETHLGTCFADSIQSRNKTQIREKIHEMVQLFRQSSSKGVKL